MNRRIHIMVATAMLSLASAAAFAGQDCLLEGKVKQANTSNGTKAIYIDFHSAKQYSKDSRCRFNQDSIQFNGLVGSQIATVSPGATVKYRYTIEPGTAPKWQLIQLSI